MNNYFSILRNTTLFCGIQEQELSAMLDCLGATRRSYPKGSYLLRAGDPLSLLGVVISGAVFILREDFWGNRTILSKVQPGEMFGETYACLGCSASVSVQADSDCTVLWLDVHRVATSCSSACSFHTHLIQNLLRAMAEKNLQLTGKLQITSQRSLREKILSYLSAQSQLAGSPAFTIPFSRQQLADYLAVDRSALSSALGKLRDEGILEFHRNQFRLHAR